MRLPSAAALLAGIGVALVLPVGCGGVASRPHASAPVSTRAPSFALPVSYETGSDPTAVEVADLNGDRLGDIVTTDSAAVSVLLNQGHGKFTKRTDYQPGGSSLAIADFNRDGARDVVVAGHRKTVSVLLNRGDGSLRAAGTYKTSGTANAVAAGDLNGDGEPDFATADQAVVSVLLNRGHGSFSSPTGYPAGDVPISVAIADLNGDGKLDLATASYEGSSAFLLNRGNGTFGRGRRYDDTSGASWVVPADLNGDGKQDLAVASNDETGDFQDDEGGPTLYPSWISGFANEGDGRFGPGKAYLQTAGYDESITAIAAHDVSRDGRADVLFAHWLGYANSAVSVLLSSGDTRFGEQIDYPVGAQDSDFVLAVGDVNRDGRQDLVTANSEERTVLVFINTPGLCAVQDVSAGGLRGEITLEHATRALEDAHCRVGEVREEAGSGEPGGRVLSQKPKFGAVLPGGSKVDLVVSSGPKR